MALGRTAVAQARHRGAGADAQTRPSWARRNEPDVETMLARVVIALIRFYQRTFSPMLGPRCRFEPSCSHYAATCIGTRGLVGGSLLSIRRLCKCHPFHPGGYDPPPGPRRVSSSPPSPPPGSAGRVHAAD
jgi:hypothetical protein